MILEPTNKPPRSSKSRSKSRSPGRPIEAGGRPTIPTTNVASKSQHPNSRGNSPDNISESSASFHENELIQPTHFRPHHPGVGSIHQGSSSSSASNNPWMPQYANRDSVRESWISSGSSDHHPYHIHHYHYQNQHQRVPPPVSSGGTSDASNKSLASSGGGGHHNTLVQRPMQQPLQPSKMVGTSVTRLVRLYLTCGGPNSFNSITPQFPNSLTPQLQKSSIFARFPCVLLCYAHENLHKNFGFLEL